MNQTLRKLLSALIGAAAIVSFFAGAVTLGSISSDGLLILRDGYRPVPGVIREGPLPGDVLQSGLILLALCLVLLIAGRAVLGGGDHKKSRNRMTLVFALLPAEVAAFFGLRYYVKCFSSLSSERMKEIFLNNSRILEVVVLILTLAIGLFAALSARSGEVSGAKESLKRDENRIKAGLMGALNAGGYDICDLIVTRYDGKKVIILLFDSQEAWDHAVEKGYDEEIRTACIRMEPDYEYRFEAR